MDELGACLKDLHNKFLMPRIVGWPQILQKVANDSIVRLAHPVPCFPISCSVVIWIVNFVTHSWVFIVFLSWVPSVIFEAEAGPWASTQSQEKVMDEIGWNALLV